jgi:hypothetical protein
MRHPGTAALLRQAVSFALCGACSGLLVDSVFFWWLGVPFALLCAALAVRNGSAAAAIGGAIGYAAVWPVAYATAVYISRWNQRLGICVGGIVGGVGVAIVTLLIERGSLSESKSLLTASAIGGIAAVPLALAFQPGFPDRLKPGGFAVWQAALGTYIYFIARKE